MKKTKIVIIGAAGRDFHNFNLIYRDNPKYQVVAFTANQIPDISNRYYPKELSGKLYPDGIPIYDEKNLEKIIEENSVDECILAYSDLSYDAVMHLCSRVVAYNAKFSVLGATQTMLVSTKPVIAVLAVRTGCGKSQTTRAVVSILKQAGKKVVCVRHPMPYGDLKKQKIQRFETLADLEKHECTIEEMEEYEPHINMDSIVYAGVDYELILGRAEKEADIIVWDGGNNDTSFYRPNLTIVVADPLRPGHELKYYPGEINLLLTDVIIVNKVNSAKDKDINLIIQNAKKLNPQALIIKAKSEILVEHPQYIRGKKVLVIEDGPTLTHGEMTIGAGTVAARINKASQIIDPRPYILGKIKQTFQKYPNIGHVLPAMGYGQEQLEDLEKTINNVPADAVVIGTPIDLQRFIKIKKPATRVKYDLDKTAVGLLKKILKAKKFI